MTTLTAPGPLDALFHHTARACSHPDASANVGVVLHLTGTAPAVAALRDHVAAHIDGLPCLTHFLTGDGSGLRWAHADPDPALHIADHALPEGRAHLDAAIAELRRTPLPENAPPWRLWQLHGHDPGAYALFYLTRHDVQDAAGIATVVEALFGPEHEPRPPSAAVPGLTGAPPSGALDLLQTARDMLGATRGHALWTWRAHPLSGERDVHWLEVPTALLHAVGRAAGGSSNDVHLAALTHAVTGWAAEHWPPADGAPLPVMVPLNLRTDDEAGAPGNRFFLGRLDLPGGRMPAATRLARTVAATAPLKSTPRRATLRRVVDGLPRQALGLLTQAGTTPDQLTVVGSSFPFRHRLRFGDDPVHRLAPLICCPDGFPMTVALFLYGQVSTACFQIDRALPGADVIPGRWRNAVDEMATALGVADTGAERPEPAPARTEPVLSAAAGR